VISALVSVAALPTFASGVMAQSCLGLPQRSSIAFESATYTAGTATGVAAALSGKHTALDLGFRARDVGDDESGIEGAIRFSVLIPISKVRLCPGLGLNYAHTKWDVDATTSMTTSILAARVGAGLGVEQKVLGDLSLIPFGGVYYQFSAIVFQIDAPDGENDVTGDTLSHTQLEWGLMAHFRFLYGGWAATRYTDNGSFMHPAMSRWVVGLTFPTGGSSSKERARPRERARASEPPRVARSISP